MCVGILYELGLRVGIMIVIIMFSVKHVAYGFLQKIEFEFVTTMDFEFYLSSKDRIWRCNYNEFVVTDPIP